VAARGVRAHDEPGVPHHPHDRLRRLRPRRRPRPPTRRGPLTMPPALVVVPTYQEADNIERVLERLRAAAPDADVLVVDDGSPDGTADLAEARGAHVLRRPHKAGLGSAYRAGFAWARQHGFRIAVEMDADLSHDPDDVPRLLAAVDDGADLAIGSRYVPGGATPDWPRRRRLLSRAGNRYART